MGGRDEGPTGRQRPTLKGSGQQRAAAAAAGSRRGGGAVAQRRALKK